MYCSTCGALIPSGRHSCDTCGTAVALPPRPPAGTVTSAPERRGWAGTAVVGVCPQCGFRGEGLPYFSRGSHLAGLVAATLLTSWAMGVGGFVYFVMRHDHQTCARCRAGWGRHGVRALVRAPAAPEVAPRTPSHGSAPTEGAKRGLAVALFILAALLAIVGISQTFLPPLLAAGVAAAGGLMLQRSADRDREQRRAALLAALQLPVLKLAAARGGRLTVTEVSAELGWTLRRSEKVLQSLDDGFRVSSEVTDQGVIVYEFREILLSSGRLAAGSEE